MIKVQVKASANYDILIEKGALKELDKLLPRKAHYALVTDSTVDRLYADEAAAKIRAAGNECDVFVFPAGEQSKTLGTYAQILSFLADKHLTRTDAVIALGGGVCGDMAGFAAASYLRGIEYIQIPTTFLAAIDSSVGGKTGVDLPEGKNLAGAFHQPSLVVCDPALFSTLPPETFADGVAEAIKYAMISDPELLALLENAGENIEEIIRRCVSIKAEIVAHDEYDNGMRRLLNFGHTVGHAIELLSDFKLTHGHAVAAGMAIVTRSAVKLGMCGEQVLCKLLAALKRHELPENCDFDARQLFDAALADKKRKGDTIAVIMPSALGRCEICEMPVAELRTIIEKGL